MDILVRILQNAFSIDSIWSVVFRGIIWLFAATLIILSAQNPNQERAKKDLKSQLSFFILFIAIAGGLIYLLFGFTMT